MTQFDMPGRVIEEQPVPTPVEKSSLIGRRLRRTASLSVSETHIFPLAPLRSAGSRRTPPCCAPSSGAAPGLRERLPLGGVGRNIDAEVQS